MSAKNDAKMEARLRARIAILDARAEGKLRDKSDLLKERRSLEWALAKVQELRALQERMEGA